MRVHGTEAVYGEDFLKYVAEELVISRQYHTRVDEEGQEAALKWLRSLPTRKRKDIMVDSEDDAESPIKHMTVKEFRQQGYLQELNRRFLHPLGLALEVKIAIDGTETFGEVWDYRNDPEGMIFAPGLIDAEKATRIMHEESEKMRFRVEKLGFHLQPVKEEEVKDGSEGAVQP